LSGDYTISDYLVTRLAQLDIRHIFGVPGDYTLAFLDRVLASRQVSWVGNANELNAAYAADGYARVAGAGAVVTTYGVGELSAINGIAGSYAEYVPVVHIVGAPSTRVQRAGALVHHTLGDGDFEHFARAHAEVTVAQAYLSAGNAAAEIDRVLATMLRERRPGYLVIPADVATAPAERPLGPLQVPPPDTSTRVLEDFTAAARAMLSRAGTLGVLADFLADRFDVRGELADLVAAGGIPHATLSMGKGVLNEDNAGFVGTYTGAESAKPVLAAIEGADLLISVGVRLTDSTTIGFSHQLDPARTIDVQPFSTRVGNREFAPLPMKAAVQALVTLVTELDRSWPQPDLQETPQDDDALPGHGELRQAHLWQAVQRFLRPADIVLADQGTAFFGAQTMRLPAGVTFISQALWASLGYTLPAALGAALAAPQRRTVLLIGDGAAQLTAQEFGTLIREDCNVITILINNDGYTIERAIQLAGLMVEIHGAEQHYNDIPAWNWPLVPIVMGGATMRTARAATPFQLNRLLDNVADAAGPVLLDAVLPRLDVPRLLTALARSATAANKRNG
jgi:indolepyruvate decarboxylase